MQDRKIPFAKVSSRWLDTKLKIEHRAVRDHRDDWSHGYQCAIEKIHKSVWMKARLFERTRPKLLAWVHKADPKRVTVYTSGAVVLDQLGFVRAPERDRVDD